MHHLMIPSRLTASQRQTFEELGIRNGDTVRIASSDAPHCPAVEAAAERVRRFRLSVASVAREVATTFGCHPKTAARWISRKLYGRRDRIERQPLGLEPPQARSA